MSDEAKVELTRREADSLLVLSRARSELVARGRRDAALLCVLCARRGKHLHLSVMPRGFSFTEVDPGGPSKLYLNQIDILMHWDPNSARLRDEGEPRESHTITAKDGMAIQWDPDLGGDADCQFQIGRELRNGKDFLCQNFPEAIRLIRKAADQGHGQAQFELGSMYATGCGVPQDFSEAAMWYRRAAEQGDTDAQFSLGNLYRHGEGVQQDYVEATKWYRKAADHGLPGAQYELGWMYYNGEVASGNYAEAAEWFRKAADQGNSSAQHLLGCMYGLGQGVPQDYAGAYFWLNLAATNATDKEEKESWSQLRDELAAKISSQELAEAQRLASEWKPTHRKA